MMARRVMGTSRALPVIAGYAIQNTEGTPSSITVPMPENQPGDLLLICIVPAGTTAAITAFDGFLPYQFTGALGNNAYVLKKRVTTPIASAALSFDVGGRHRAIALCVKNTTDTLIGDGAGTGALDPPSFTIPWGASKPSLILALAGMLRPGNGCATGAPSGYSEFTTTATTGTSNAYSATQIAHTIGRFSSVNPGAFPVTGTPYAGLALTIAIEGL